MFTFFKFIHFLKRNIFIKSILFGLLGVVTYLLYLSLFNIEYMRETIEDPAFRYFNAFLSDKTESFSKPNIFIFEVNNKYLKERNLLDEDNRTNKNYGYFLPRKYIIEFIQHVDKLTIKPRYVLIDFNLNYPSNSLNQLSVDDNKLIALLNDKSRKYKIFIPHNRKYNFLENKVTNKNVIFCSTLLSANKDEGDEITKRFETYETINDKNYTNIILLLSENNITNYNQYHVIENRILFKNRINNHNFWNNIHYYSTFNDMYETSPDRYKEGIILFGANYIDSKDIHKVQTSIFDNHDIAGVEVIANAVMSLYYFDNKLKAIDPNEALFLIFMYAFIAKLITLIFIKYIHPLKNYETSIFIGLFFIISSVYSYYIFIIYKLWFNYLIPVLIWSIYDGFNSIFPLILGTMKKSSLLKTEGK